MTNEAAQEKIQEMVRRIVAAFHPEKVVLFGSYARGTAGPDSDVDLLVVMPFSGKRRDLVVEIRGHLHGLGLAKDIVVSTPEEFIEDQSIAGTIPRAAYLEGKVLYDRAA